MKIPKKTLTAAAISIFALLTANPEKINFRADYMTGRNGSKSDTTKLIGNAFVQTETMEIKADTITMSGDNFRYITAEGNVDGLNTESDMTFTCGKMKYDRTTKIARLEDTVKMVDKKNDVTADAQIIEYNQNTEVALMQIGVKILQKDNTCTSAHAIYRKKEQTLDMSGNPKITQGEDTFRAQEISLNMETNEITLDGRVSGTVTDTKKEEAADTATEDKEGKQ
ncbi:MAG: organic solvent tolerance protein OstA [Treponema sp.]|nr:organic solvent tolerance protein OstA [Treponema sp.]